MTGELDLVCGGAISGSAGKRFCTRFECSVKAHKNSGVLLAPNTLYVKAKKDQARWEPSLSALKLPGSVDVKKLAQEEKSMEVWAAYFEGLEARHDRLTNAAGPQGEMEQHPRLARGGRKLMCLRWLNLNK